MTDTNRTLLEKYQVRKTKRQKDAFIEFATQRARSLGYTVTVESGSLGSRNIVVGNPKDATVIYTAHYDTAPRLPFPNFITPKCLGIYLIYQIALVLMLLLPAMLIGITVGVLLGLTNIDIEFAAVIGEWAYILSMLLFFFLMLAGPANKNTANDNTSGVATLLSIMERLEGDGRETAAFIFFDLEEVGLVGSSTYKKAHKDFIDKKPLINFDCVSDGEHILLVAAKGAKSLSGVLGEAFTPDGKYTVEVAERGVFYPSDQAAFALGVGVCALKRTRGGLLYMNRIHTKRDTVFSEENIDFIAERAVRLLNIVKK